MGLPLSERGRAPWVLAGVLATATTVRHALRARTADAERIFAALDAYLLIGLMFGVLYQVLDRTWPQSIGGPGELSIADAIYFSFITIATLG